MESLKLFDLALIICAALGGVALIHLLGVWISRRASAAIQHSKVKNATVFLFDGDRLADATLDAHQMIKDSPKNLTERQAVIAVFQDRFPTLDYVMRHIAAGGCETLNAADAASQTLKVEDAEGQVRVTLEGATPDDHQNLSAGAAQESLLRELKFLRDLMDNAPQLVWTQNGEGRLTWANAAYMQFSDQQLGHSFASTQKWPDQPIFPDLHLDATQRGAVSRRVMLHDAETRKEIWYDVTTRKLGKDIVHFANNAGAAVKAEQSKVKAMKTSGRLFANLATGLAIFDQRRQLAIFNPRLTDLTRLQPSFLMARPTLDRFLDALRESRVLPEPKDYASWREQFSALEDAARAGTYCENWELIDGQTFRVTGKPYEDKSFVFLFDDITAEVNLTRRFKTDIETGQGVMDAQSHALAVFTNNGTLVMSNRAYKDLWQSDHDGSMTSHQLRSEIATWQQHAAAAPAWGDLRNFIAGPGGSAKWVDHLIHEDGRHIQCEAEKINANMSLISFKSDVDRKMAPIIHKLTMKDPSFRSAKR